MARFAIGRLYRAPQNENYLDSTANTCEDGLRGSIAGLGPMNFVTVATPHLGSRGNKQVFICFCTSNIIICI